MGSRRPHRRKPLLVSKRLALAISFFTQILGALPVFAFSVLPAMAALRSSRNLTMALMCREVAGLPAASSVTWWHSNTSCR
jgi:ABC-type Mn2+/Zn2+ transport system permease subunit